MNNKGKAHVLPLPLALPGRGRLWILAIATMFAIIWRQDWRALLLGQLSWWSPWAAGMELLLLLLANAVLAPLLISAVLRLRIGHGGQLQVEWRCTGEELPARELRWPGWLAVLQTVLLEEILARALFAMALPALFGGSLIAWALAGNLLWALLHLTNRDIGRPHPLKVLPQFVGGLVYLVAFLLFGLIAAVATHFTYNAAVYALPALGRRSERRPALSTRRGPGH